MLLLPPGQRPSGPAAAAELDFRIIPAGFNTPLEFLTGFTLKVKNIHLKFGSTWRIYNDESVIRMVSHRDRVGKGESKSYWFMKGLIL